MGNQPLILLGNCTQKKKLQGQCLPRKSITNCILGHSMLSKFEVDVDINGLWPYQLQRLK